MLKRTWCEPWSLEAPIPVSQIVKSLHGVRVAVKNECDYVKEAEMTRKMRAFLEGDATFGVPRVFSELSTRHVITTEMLTGVPIDQVGWQCMFTACI